MKKIQGFEAIDRKKAAGLCLTALENTLDFARSVVPDLCKGFTSSSEVVNVTELMTLTCWRPTGKDIGARWNNRINLASKAWAQCITGDGLENFHKYLIERGWERPMETVELLDESGSPIPGTEDSVEIRGNDGRDRDPDDGVVFVDEDGQAMTPGPSPTFANDPPVRPLLQDPVDEDVLEAVLEHLNPDRPSGPGAGEW